jgi:prenyltransferase beta subunit
MTKTCWVGALIAVCLASLAGHAADEKQRTIEYLRTLQAADGGFLPTAAEQANGKRAVSSLRATSAALRALRYQGGEPRDRSAAARFVGACFDKSAGAFSDQPRSRPDVNATAVGLMAVEELHMPMDRYRGAASYLGLHAQTFEEIRIAAAGLEAARTRPPQATRWVGQIVETCNSDGTFGKGDGAARDTGGAVVALLRLGAHLEHEDNVVRCLKNGQRPDGGFGKGGTATSDLESTYRVLRAFVMLHQKPENVTACRAFISRCRNADGGYGVAPGQPSTASGTYFASIILHWLET